MKLLKYSLLGLLFVAFCPKANSQALGVRAGVNIATVTDADTRTGYYIGAYKEFSIVSKVFFIQPELQYSKQGFSTDTADIDLSYLNVPVLAKVYALKLLSFEAGPQFGFNVGDSGADYLDYNTYSTSWVAGASFNMPLGFSINARYIGGFNDVVKNADSKSQVVQIGAAFQF
ncbi:MAG: porin family protein [Flavobacterium sp.]